MRSSRRGVTLGCLLKAISNGICRFADRMDGSAPLLSKWRTMTMSPPRAAKCKGVSCRLAIELTNEIEAADRGEDMDEGVRLITDPRGDDVVTIGVFLIGMCGDSVGKGMCGTADGIRVKVGTRGGRGDGMSAGEVVN